MAILHVIAYPDDRLRKKSAPVEQFDDKLAALINDMMETMHNTDNCAGFAAVQFGIYQRVIVIHKTTCNQNEPMYLVNPEIIAKEGKTMSMEGCISIPGAFEKVSRAATVTIRTYDKTGQAREFEASEFFACCLQHEVDHLNGILFLDHLSPIKRERVRKKITEYKKSIM